MLIGTGLPRRRWDILALFIVAAAILVVRSAASRDPAFDMPVPYAHPIIDGKHSLENQVKNEYMRATKTKCPTDNPRPTYFELKARSLELLRAGDANLARICMQAAMDLYFNRVGQFGILPSELPALDEARPYLDQAQRLVKALPGAQVPPGVPIHPLFKDAVAGGGPGVLQDDTPSTRMRRDDDAPVLDSLRRNRGQPSSLPTSKEIPTPTHHQGIEVEDESGPQGKNYWASNLDAPVWRTRRVDDWVNDPTLQLRVATIYSAQLILQRDNLGQP